MDEKSLWKFISCTTYPIGLGDQRDALMRHTATPVSLSFPFGLLWRDATPSSPFCPRSVQTLLFPALIESIFFSIQRIRGNGKSGAGHAFIVRFSRVVLVEYVAGIIGLATK